MGATTSRSDRRARRAPAAIGNSVAEPSAADRMCHTANELRHRRQYQAAIDTYREALAADPDHFAALTGLGGLLGTIGQRDEGVALVRRALATDPTNRIARVNLGTILRDQQELDESVAIFRALVREFPDDPHSWFGLGMGLQAQGRTNHAVKALERSAHLAPHDDRAHTALGHIYFDADRVDDAERAYLRAVEESQDVVTLGNLSRFYARLNRFELAERYCQSGLDAGVHDTDLARVMANRAFLRLAQGRLAEAWEDYEWNWKLPERKPNRKLAAPKWKGEPITDKTLLVWGEQGIGDEILFSSIIPDAIERAGHLIVEFDPRLTRLLARSFPRATVRDRPPIEVCEAGTDDPGPIDVHCSIFELAAQCRRSLDDFPVVDPRLAPDPRRAAVWDERLAALGDGLRVGITWRSSLATHGRARLYTRLDQWGPILTVPGVHFVNVQYDDSTAEVLDAVDRIGTPIHRVDQFDLMHDMDELSALLANLDVVIGCSNATGQLAAAVGTDVWDLCDGHGIGTLSTDHYPWRRSKRVFMRDPYAPWDRLIIDVAKALETRVASR